MEQHTKRHAITLILVVVLASSLLAGGRREREEDTQPEPSRQGDRIEFGTAVEPAEPDTGEVELPDQERDGETAPLWVLVDHELTQQLEREISSIIRQGYTPVGMETIDDGISILYLLTPAVTFDRWVIHEFTDLSVLNEEFSAFLVDGWLPMGFSKDGDSITALFVRSRETEIEGWRIHDVPAGELQQLIEVVEAYNERGFVPYGLSIDPTDDRIWLLVLETATAPGEEGRRPNVLINAFAEDDIFDGITRDIEQGAFPWAMSRGDEASFFLYLF